MDINVTAYMDDILIYTERLEDEHQNKVREVLTNFDEAGLYLDSSKYEFLCKRVKYSGFIISVGDSITINPGNIKAIEDQEPPKIVKVILSFIGFEDFYRYFINKFSEIKVH